MNDEARQFRVTDEEAMHRAAARVRPEMRRKAYFRRRRRRRADAGRRRRREVGEGDVVSKGGRCLSCRR